MSDQNPLKVAIVGLGHLHPRPYMPLFNDVADTVVTAVVEPDPDQRLAFCADFEVPGYDSIDGLLAEREVDIAAIFLPHVDCPEAAEKFAAKGVHLMVEKPMAASSAGAQRIVDAARTNGVKLTTGYCWRLHPMVAEIRQLIANGILGKLVGVEGRCAAGRLHRYIEGNSPWILQKARSGGGPMYNLGVHWIDLFRHMLGANVEQVSGRNVKLNTEFDVEDNSFAHLQFDNGVVGALDISYTVPDAFPFGRDLYVSIRGTQGVVSWAPAYEGEKDVLHIVSDHPDFQGAPKRQLSLELAAVSGYSGIMGLEYIEGFAEAIRQDTDPAISGEDGVAALKVVEAIYAADRDQRWTTVS